MWVEVPYTEITGSVAWRRTEDVIRTVVVRWLAASEVFITNVATDDE